MAAHFVKRPDDAWCLPAGLRTRVTTLRFPLCRGEGKLTIVVSLKVNDGLVLATDSATTFMDGDGRPVKVYNNANKLFNLVKVWPLGAMTYGAGSIGSASISTLSKDLRRELDPATGRDPSMRLDRENYTVEGVAERARRFLFSRYQAAYPGGVPNYFMGYRVGGYSSGSMLAECWEVGISGTETFGPSPICALDSFGPRWAGETEALDRLILGVGSRFVEVLEQLGVSKEAAASVQSDVIDRLSVPLYLPAMPIQDAIDMATFLAETAAKFTQFSLRAATVGGPIEVATITKYEGFKWVSRKHYFSADYNLGSFHAAEGFQREAGASGAGWLDAGQTIHGSSTRRCKRRRRTI